MVKYQTSQKTNLMLNEQNLLFTLINIGFVSFEDPCFSLALQRISWWSHHEAKRFIIYDLLRIVTVVRFTLTL